MKEILKKLESYYENLESYIDEGLVIVAGRPLDSGCLLKFKTYFKRPNLFRFEYVNPFNKNPEMECADKRIILCDGTSFGYLELLSYQKPMLEYHKSMEEIVSIATGVSFGSAHHIASLLMPNLIRGFRLSDLRINEVNDALDNIGKACTELTCSHPRTLGVKLRIDKSTGLLSELWETGRSTERTLV